MKEIMGNKLTGFFNNFEMEYNPIFTCCGNKYEIWQISDELYKKMCNMTEEEFSKLAWWKNAWWQASEGSNLKVPNKIISVNDYKMIGWGNEGRNRKYENLSDYLFHYIHTLSTKDWCPIVTDLAKYNKMTLTELFLKYEYGLIDNKNHFR